MARTPDALIRPELLVWARQSAGFDLDTAAARLRVSAERLRSWEAGATRPTVAQLRAAARVYRRPLAVFYLPEPPRDFQPLRDFRRLPAAELGRLSPELLAVIRRARAVREAALELRELAEEPVAAAPALADGASDPERFGAAARALLGVNLEQQAGWRDGRRALNAWLEAVSALDVLVLQAQSISLAEMRGFSIAAERLPVIVLNGGDFPRARTFTLLHELVHVLLHADGVCDALPRRRVRGPADEVEVFCNRAAAAALMPLDAFQAEPVLRRVPAGGRWSEDVIRGLAERYAVSQEAVVRRLHSVGLADWAFLQESVAAYRAAYEAHREGLRRRRREAPGGPTYYRLKVRDLGRGFIGSALDAYHRRAITGSDLSEYLEIKLNLLPGLEAELAATGGARD